MKKKSTLLVIACVCGYLTFSQTLIDDFTDGNFTSSQTWTGNTAEFSVITDATIPNGSASTDGTYLASNPSQGDISLAFASNEISEWRFSIGSPDFDPSGTNYLGVVLMANAPFSGDLINDNVTNDFKGYYLRIGDIHSDAIELWRKTGLGEEIVGEFPNSPSFSTGALQNGLNIRVTRNSSGVFELFYSIGFQNNSFPSTSAGRLTNTAYSTSNYFGIYQNIGSLSDNRRIYIDNIELGVVTWDGSENNNWAIAENWDTNLNPTSSDNLIIPSNLSNYPTVTTAETVNSILFESSATLIANNAGFSVTNDVIYNRVLTNGSQWYYISSPVVGETYNDSWVSANSIASGQNNNRGVSSYNNTEYDMDSDGGGPDTETGYWRYLQATESDTFKVGQGYGIITANASTTVSFIGTGIYASSQMKPITTDVSNYNLVGNPFTAYLNLGDFFADNGASVITGASAYFWNGSSYDTRTSILHNSFEIAPGQGFFIEAADDLNLTFDIADVTHQGTETFQKISRPEIQLFVTNRNDSRYAKIYYMNEATTAYDVGYDGKLFGGITQSFALYSHLVSNNEGKHFQLQCLPNSNHEDMVIPIGLNVSSGEEITFSAESFNLPSGLNVFLEDRQTNTFTRIDEINNNYTIALTEKIEGIGRFYLHTKNKILDSDSYILESISIYILNTNQLRIIGLAQGLTDFKLFNILGKQLVHSSFSSNGIKDIDIPKLAKGIYVVHLETKNGKLNTKLIIE